MGGLSSRITHFSAAKQCLRAGWCLKVVPRIQRGYLSHAGGWLSQWMAVAFLSGTVLGCAEISADGCVNFTFPVA